MCTTRGVTRLADALAELTDDPTDQSDQEIRTALPTLLTAFNQLGAVIAGVVGVFDARDLAQHDACATAASWLRAFGRMTPNTATAWVKRARLLRDLPALRDGALSGAVSTDHLRKVADLVNRLDTPTVAPFDEILADLAGTAGPAELQKACERIAAHADPDGAHPDPHAAFERRGLTLSRVGSMVAIRGQLDPEAGAALLTALDATMAPPPSGDLRTPAQRRADAFTELINHALGAGQLPTVHGIRPHLGILITPATLLGQAEADDENPDALSRAGVPPGSEPARLDWYGDLPAAIAQRIACDCDTWRAVLDPATGLPLELGRTHRIVPHWMRKALHARDHGCRFPGCEAPAAWTDAHHRQAWYDGGPTDIDNLLSLCRFHHVMVHEGRWTLTWDHTTGAVYAYRPDGTPYELGPSLPHTSPTRQRAA